MDLLFAASRAVVSLWQCCCMRPKRADVVNITLLGPHDRPIEMPEVTMDDAKHLMFCSDDIVLVHYPTTDVIQIFNENERVMIQQPPLQRSGTIPFIDATIVLKDGMEVNHNLDLGQYRLRENTFTSEFFRRVCLHGSARDEFDHVLLTTFDESGKLATKRI